MTPRQENMQQAKEFFRQAVQQSLQCRSKELIVELLAWIANMLRTEPLATIASSDAVKNAISETFLKTDRRDFIFDVLFRFHANLGNDVSVYELLLRDLADALCMKESSDPNQTQRLSAIPDRSAPGCKAPVRSMASWPPTAGSSPV
jgi:hypothetical protein